MSNDEKGCAVVIIMILTAILGFGIGLIFLPFLKALGIGMVSIIVGVIIASILYNKL